MENIIKELENIVKTTSNPETRAEVKRVLESWYLTESILAGDYLDIETSQITINGESISLTTQEAKTIEALVLAERPMNRNELLYAAWDCSFVGPRTVDVHIRKLRKKIGAHLITTRRGVGYSINKSIKIKTDV